MTIPIVSIVAAHSGTGKTTLIKKLIPELKQLGLRVAVVKSDGHGFELDREGKDTWQFTQAGADAVAIVGPNQYAVIQKTAQKKPLAEVAGLIRDVDLIIVESRSHGLPPVLEIARAGVTEQLITPVGDLRAVISDCPNWPTERPILPLDEVEAVAAFIWQMIN